MEKIQEFHGDYRGVEPDGEHWISPNAIRKLLLGEGIHMLVLIEHEGEVIEKTITIKHGPGLQEYELKRLRNLLNHDLD